MIDSIHQSKCTGCKMCADLCPKGAIEFEEDYTGFWYPVVDANKCNKCGVCVQKCPSLKAMEKVKMEPIVYAAWSKNKEERLNCTSGGLCYELSRFVLKSGGYVAGVQYTNDYKGAEYTIIHSENDLEKLTQTKYFQAESAKIYQAIKQLLENSEKVLFVGTPCCNAALNRFLVKKYENLIQCDFVCRGMPSPKVHRLEVEYMEKKYNSSIIHFQDKNKTKGWSCFGTSIKFKNGKKYFKDRYHHPMTSIFTAQDMNVREACYHCQYRNLSRQSDVTVGDFWGIEGVEKENYFYGVSLLMLNTKKGEMVFEAIKSELEYVEKTVEEVARGNPVLLNQFHKTPNCDQFFKDIDSIPFEQVLRKYVPQGIDRYIMQFKSKIKKILNYALLLQKISIRKFIYYNFLSKNVVRRKGCYLIPYCNSCIELHKTAKLYLNAKMFLNTMKMQESKAECYFRMSENSTLKVDGKVELGYYSALHINHGGFMEIGGLTTNNNCSIVCSHKITMGKDVMFGRSVTVYDSDYHDLNNMNGEKLNKDKPVDIGSHVWVGTGAMIMKGSKIGDEATISANAWIVGRVKSGAVVAGMPARVIMENTGWTK